MRQFNTPRTPTPRPHGPGSVACQPGLAELPPKLAVLMLAVPKLAVPMLVLMTAIVTSWRGTSADEQQRGTSAGPPAEFTEAEALFAHRVLPILREKCFACHGEKPDDVRGEFNMLSRDGLLRGGESGEPAIIAGEPADSPLYRAVLWQDLEMPPKENDRLNATQIANIETWIRGGAPWPDETRLAEIEHSAGATRWQTSGIAVETSGGLSADWNRRRYDPQHLWAYVPLPTVVDVPGPTPAFEDLTHPVDRFLAPRLESLGITAAPPADRRTWLRRATFDLLGLPPTPEEVAAFVNDSAPDDIACAAVVDRLLASPHYGEQWGRHWLDIARYADSSGYANDFERGNAWRYRDYVVRAFNDDKPYDAFVREQLAGDEIDPHNPELLVAVGFLRMGPWELTAMEVPKIARQRFLDDVTDAVGQVFLGHMLRCASCHDHKFDPVPTRDYYAIQAAFATTQLAERHAPFLEQENTRGFDERRVLEDRLRRYQTDLQTIRQKSTLAAARQWYQDQGRDPTVFEAVVAKLGTTHLAEIRKELIRRGTSEDDVFPQKVGFTPADFGRERVANKGIQRMRWQLDRYEPYALSVYDGLTPNLKAVNAPLRVPASPDSDGTLENTCILIGGDPFSPGDRVRPGVLSVVRHWSPASAAGWESGGALSPSALSGRRTALANWVASDQNPLTARVMVNRIWQWHFGTPLAATPNNFGATGKPPTHPQLLDFLARYFIDSGWSVKEMHRLIMSSQAYRRSARHPAPRQLATQDPLGTSYATFTPRRLEAEELRDAMLAVSGELNPELGGIPVRPEMAFEAAMQPRMVMGTFAEAWQPSPLPSQRHRRTIYALKLRGLRDPFQEVFNVPVADVSCEARETSTIAPQVFAMFNSQITYDRALALATRVSAESDSAGGSVDRLFQLCYGRAPTPRERDICLQHWQDMTKRHQQLQFSHPEYPTEIQREAVEENTGVKFTYTEPLEWYTQFVPDLKPTDASPPIRGLAEVCLVVLNSNEFVYVE